MSTIPRLRPLDFHPVIYQDQKMWLVQDPFELTDYQIIFTPDLAQLLWFFDGSRDSVQIQMEFQSTFGEAIDLTTIHDVISKLDEACLLENDRSTAKKAEVTDAFRRLPHRSPTLAGLGYSAVPQELNEEFRSYGKDDNLNGWLPWQGRGIISPHIDYQRGGPVYAKVWRRASKAIAQAELVLIFGTDHNGSPGRVTLTKKPYATPYGVIPSDGFIVDALAETLGEDAFSEELHHRKEHSVELAAVWLHYILRLNQRKEESNTKMIPILCGSFHHYIFNGEHPRDDRRIDDFVNRLHDIAKGKRVLAVGSVDLAHVGPNFGDDFVMDSQRRESLWQSDHQLMDAISSGDADLFYDQVAAVDDQNRICGLSSIYLMLRYLGPTSGKVIEYQQCPADVEDNSLVSICGILLD